MAVFSSIPFFENPDPVLKTGRIGLLCNQTAWHPGKGEYLFESLYKRGCLKRVFIPEHGLFGELQDQLKLDGKDLYGEFKFSDCEFLSLYGGNESSLIAPVKKLIDLDVLIIELQDAGVRYYTFLSTLRNLFITLKNENIPLPVYILDRENPAGQWVEGSPLLKEYASFIGIEGLPHRHGLTIGEIANFFHYELEADFPLTVVSWKTQKKNFPWTIPPSPNIPGFFTFGFYSGQCLWEGTNVSEGRGTTRPFEVFGAPWMKKNLVNYNRNKNYMNWNDPSHPLYDFNAALRWHCFIPTFHKYKDESCFGFQLIRRNMEKPYHSLLHALRIINFVGKNCEDFTFRPGKYETGSDKTAIELLTGDPLIISYLKGEGADFSELTEHFKKCEKEWIKKINNFRFYEEPLISIAQRMTEVY